MDRYKEIALLRKSIKQLVRYRIWYKVTFGAPDDDYRIDMMLYTHKRRLNELLLQKGQV